MRLEELKHMKNLKQEEINEKIINISNLGDIKLSESKKLNKILADDELNIEELDNTLNEI